VVAPLRRSKIAPDGVVPPAADLIWLDATSGTMTLSIAVTPRNTLRNRITLILPRVTI